MLQKGFTLIELLVVVSIILLLSGVGVANFLSFQEKKQVETTTEAIRELAVTARNRAQSRQTPDISGVCDPTSSPVLAYHLLSSGNAVEIRPVCGRDVGDLSNESLNLVSDDDRVLVPADWQLSTPLSVYFYALGSGGANLDGTPMPITLDNGSGVKFGFSIEETGLISEVEAVE